MCLNYIKWLLPWKRVKNIISVYALDLQVDINMERRKHDPLTHLIKYKSSRILISMIIFNGLKLGRNYSQEDKLQLIIIIPRGSAIGGPVRAMVPHFCLENSILCIQDVYHEPAWPPTFECTAPNTPMPCFPAVRRYYCRTLATILRMCGGFQ